MSFQEDLSSSPSVAENEEIGLDLVEVAGSIKWFDVAKGYGFVVPDDGSDDFSARHHSPAQRISNRL